jgi:hemoglobin
MSTSLYERLGGASGIAALVDDIVDAHMHNPAIKARFLPYIERPEHLAGVKRHIRDFFGAGSGGPESYQGRDMGGAHRGMNISTEEYFAAVDDIMAAMEKHAIDESARKDVLAIAYALKGEIVRA